MAIRYYSDISIFGRDSLIRITLLNKKTERLIAQPRVPARGGSAFGRCVLGNRIQENDKSVKRISEAGPNLSKSSGLEKNSSTFPKVSNNLTDL